MLTIGLKNPINGIAKKFQKSYGEIEIVLDENNDPKTNQ